MGQLTYKWFYDLIIVLQNLFCSRFKNNDHGLAKYQSSEAEVTHYLKIAWHYAESLLDSHPFINVKKCPNVQVEPEERRWFLKTLPFIVLSHFTAQFSFLNQHSFSADRESEGKRYYSTSLCQYQQSINRRNPAKSLRTANHTHTHKAGRSNAADPWASCPIKETPSS